MGVLDEAIREHLELRRRNGASDQEIAVKQAEALGPARRDVADEAESSEDRSPASDGSPERLEEASRSSSLEDSEPAPAASLGSTGLAEDPPAPRSTPALEGDLFDVEAPAPGTRSVDETELPSETEPEPPGAYPAGEAPAAGQEADSDLALADERLDIDTPTAIEAEEADTTAPSDRDALPEDDPPPASAERSAPPPWRAVDTPDAPAERHDRPGRSAPAASEPQPDPADDVLEETPDFLQETPEHERLWFEQRPPRDFDFDD